MRFGVNDQITIPTENKTPAPPGRHSFRESPPTRRFISDLPELKRGRPSPRGSERGRLGHHMGEQGWTGAGRADLAVPTPPAVPALPLIKVMLSLKWGFLGP